MVRTALGRPYGLVMISLTVEGTKRNAQIRNTEGRRWGLLSWCFITYW